MRRSALGPLPRRARPRHSPGVVLAAAVSALVVLVSLGVIAMHLLRPEQVAAPPTAPTVAPPAAGPGEWRLPERRWEPLPPPDPASALYPAQVTRLDAQPPVTLVGCPAPSTVVTLEQWRDVVRDQWSCTHRSWTPVFERLGWPTTMPAVEFFSGEGGDSACGYLAAPAFYCSAGDGTVHFGSRHFDMARTWELSVNEMVAHEYGHHLQHLAGISAAKLALPWGQELERRAELQATCWSAAMTFHNASVGFGQAEYESWLERLATMHADGVHGSQEALRHWGTRGLYASTMDDCNTWVVSETHVS